MSSKSQSSLSIVVPVFNNEEEISRCIKELKKLKALYADFFEIILVDDGSVDSSWEKILDQSNEQKEVKGLKLKRNVGQFEATRIGVAYTKGELICTIDCDLEQNPNDIPLMIELLKDEEHQLVFALAENKYELKGMSKRLSKWRNQLLNLVLSKPPTDSFRVFKRGLLFDQENYLQLEKFEAYISKNTDSEQIAYYNSSNQLREKGKSQYDLLIKLKLLLYFLFDYAVKPGFLFIALLSTLAIGLIAVLMSPLGWILSMIAVTLMVFGGYLILDSWRKYKLRVSTKPEEHVSQLTNIDVE